MNRQTDVTPPGSGCRLRSVMAARLPGFHSNVASCGYSVKARELQSCFCSLRSTYASYSCSYHSRVPSGKLIVAQPVSNIPAFYATRHVVTSVWIRLT
jgi:hypothetical protein